MISFAACMLYMLTTSIHHMYCINNTCNILTSSIQYITCIATHVTSTHMLIGRPISGMMERIETMPCER
jgi:hypothetical protein